MTLEPRRRNTAETRARERGERPPAREPPAPDRPKRVWRFVNGRLEREA